MSVSQTKFQADLAAGQKGERHVAATLKKHYGALKVSTAGQCKGFDFRLIFTEMSELYEVKTDFRAAKTGNLFFELMCAGKLSGLSSTTSDKWAILIPHLQHIMVFKPKWMLEELQKCSSARLLKGGDRMAVQGYVVAIDVVKEFPGVEMIPTNTRLTTK